MYTKITCSDFLEIYNNLVVWVLSLNEKAVFQYLAGIIDGDGTWSSKHNVIQVYTGDKNIVSSLVIAGMKLGIMPYVSKQRDFCYVVEFSEKIEEILTYTQRVKGKIIKKKYGSKLFAAKQLFRDYGKLKWPYYHKALRNNLMSAEKIAEHLHKYPLLNEKIHQLIESPLRMQRVKKMRDCSFQTVYNISVEKNHNYIVFTDTFAPILVKNCHGAGRLMSRHAANKKWRGEEIKKELEKEHIYVKAASWSGISEEAPGAYKDVDEVVKVSDEAGIGKIVCQLKPMGVVKG